MIHLLLVNSLLFVTSNSGWYYILLAKKWVTQVSSPIPPLLLSLNFIRDSVMYSAPVWGRRDEATCAAGLCVHWMYCFPHSKRQWAFVYQVLAQQGCLASQPFLWFPVQRSNELNHAMLTGNGHHTPTRNSQQDSKLLEYAKFRTLTNICFVGLHEMICVFFPKNKH